jgi:hypothetical protein
MSCDDGGAIPIDDDEKVGLEWVAKLRLLIDDNWDQRHVVTSNDVDGLLSAMIVCELTGARLIGFYVNWALVLFDGHTADDARDALWVDLDVLGDIRCIGNHLLHAKQGDVLSGRNELSVNLNEMYGQCVANSFRGYSQRANCKDKMPFSTVCMLVYALRDRLQARFPSLDPDTLLYRDACENKCKNSISLLSLLAHADSTYNVVQMYRKNSQAWISAHFYDAPYMQTLLDYQKNTAFLENHKQLVKLFDKVEPSRRFFWGDLAPQPKKTGNATTFDYRFQTLQFPGAKNLLLCVDLERLNSDWMPTVQSLIDTLGKVSRWNCLSSGSVRQLGKITSVLRGVDESLNCDPSFIVPARLADDGVFSHAIIFRGCIKVTRRFALRDMADAWRISAQRLLQSVEEPRLVMIKTGQPYDVYIGNSILLHNGVVYSVSYGDECWNNSIADSANPAAAYKAELMCSPFIIENLWQLAGKRLGCWCDPKICAAEHDKRQCHGHVLIDAFRNLAATVKH